LSSLRFSPIFAILFVIISFIILNPLSRRGDEAVHYQNIYDIAYGTETAGGSALTMPPVYHSVVAYISKHTLGTSFEAVRKVNFLLNMLALFLFALAVKASQRAAQERDGRLLLFVLFPLIIPLYTFVYTDIFALCFILIGIIGTLKEKFVISWLGFVLAVAIRPINFFWLIFPLILQTFETDVLNIEWLDIKKLLLKNILPLLTCIAWLSLIVIHGAVLYDRSIAASYPISSLYNGNLVFFLALLPVLFLPQSIRLVFKIYKQFHARDKKTMLLTLTLLTAAVFTAYYIFSAAHPANAPLGPNIRNHALLFLKTQPSVLACCLGLGMLLCCDWLKANIQIRAVLLVAFLTLPWIWMIEQRYYLPFFTALILFIPKEELETKFLALWWLLLSAMTLYLFRYHDMWF
jgi:hypothetical protein